MSDEHKDLSLLGSKGTDYPTEYSPDILEAFPNRHPGSDQWVTFVCTEFTSLCPITNQPDFARIFINYIADKEMVESKSLKLYLFSFRNKGDFHENCVQSICNDIKTLIKPKFIEIVGEFTPRGGVCIFPYASSANQEQKYQELRKSRLTNYSPGKYSFNLGRPY